MRVNGAHPLLAGLPKLPHPYRLFVPSLLSASHITSAPTPLPRWRVMKNTGLIPAGLVASVHEDALFLNSATDSQTCHPSAHRSAAEHPAPSGRGPSLPPWRPH